MREMLESPSGRLSVADDLLVDQVQKRIVEIAKGEAPPLEETTEAAEETHPDADAEPQQEPPLAAEEEVEGGPEGESDQEPAESAPEAEAGAEAESVESN